MTREPWPDYFFGIAKVVATRSTCPRKQVGCVIVRENRILATGYNGSPPGEAHCDDEGCDIEVSPRWGIEHCVRTVHAEANAIATAARFGTTLDGATAYVTLNPCERCSKLLKSAGVIAVHHLEDYP